MARIIDSSSGGRKTIQLSADDIISVVQEYQQITKGYRYFDEIRDILENRVVYLPAE